MSTQAITIRPATPLDLDALVSLAGGVLSLHSTAHPSLFRDQPPPAEIAEATRAMIDDPTGLCLVAEDRAVCGCLYAQFQDRQQNWCRPPLRFCNISHLVIHPESRRKGIARLLIDALVQEAGQRGFPRIELEVWSFNQEARAAFTHLGFEPLSERMELRRPG